MNATARYFIRAGLSTALAFLSALAAAMPDGISGTEWVVMASATVSAAGLYLGIGAASETVEPRVGNAKPEDELIAEMRGVGK